MQIQALRAIAGEDAVALIKREPDEAIARMVTGWPGRFDTRRAMALGFRAETSVEQLIQVHLEDEPVRRARRTDHTSETSPPTSGMIIL